MQSFKFLMWIWTFMKLRIELNHRVTSEKYLIFCLGIWATDLIHSMYRNPEKRKSSSRLYGWTKTSEKLQCWCPYQLKITAQMKKWCSTVKSGIWRLPLLSQFLPLISNNDETSWDDSLQQQCFNKTETEPDPEASSAVKQTLKHLVSSQKTAHAVEVQKAEHRT